jgi:Tol biopolymer transport system component
MDLASGKEQRITNMTGYDGGAWFSPDGTKLIWRASRPKTESEIKEYKDLLAENLVAPTNMEVWVANADGSNAHQVTSYGQANWAPAYMPDSKRIIFASKKIVFCSNRNNGGTRDTNVFIADWAE